ncbi:chemotaxis protein CheX [Azorhizobium sp. AG788]|uniref:chemotaxis protein CheX n=1 Tax=Azorhizobium sp. AG788 TaxID=2183897 RepID=UPI00313A41DC
MSTAEMLDELERDALTELVNIGVSRAAANLRKMVGEQVLLSVPAVEVMARDVAATMLGERESGELVAVRQDFEGVFSGRALLIFPQSNSMALVHAVTGGTLSADEAAKMEHEALAETGNVVLNSCLATMANMLKRPLTMSLPEVMRGDGSQLLSVMPAEKDGGIVLFLYINFAINDHNIRGYIAMLMDIPSLQALKVLIADFIERVVGGAG